MNFRKTGLTLALACAALLMAACSGQKKAEVPVPTQESVLEAMRLANDHFMNKWPDPGQGIDYPSRNRVYESNLWTRAVYYEGLLELYNLDPEERYMDYMVRWGESHNWGLRGGDDPVRVRNADNQCAGQAYIELAYRLGRPEYMHDIKAAIDGMMATDKVDDWTWIDAVQMAMPIFAMLGVVEDDSGYFDRAHEMYLHTKNVEGGGLYNADDGLWWRDKDFVPPYTEPNGEDCYWSRGNGWVIMAMARMLYILPDDVEYRAEYRQMLRDMSEALVKVQREDGLWNVSLHDPDHFGGKELSGTAMFVYGMAYGVNHGILDRATYEPVIYKAWNGMVNDCLHPDGFLGYIQGTGKEPAEAQPVTYDREPDFDDYALGAFLCAGCEVYRMLE
ncbi:MAG: glycoside hydrolase family 88 protein [Rikenellaceae bacterium]|nr:glycoside hydrolase family 88 protein [Rikenellaceae bacterium]